MRPNHVLAFDLGASNGRAVLGQFDGERMRMEEMHRFETPITESGGHIRWDIDALWHELEEGLRAALVVAPDLRSVSVDSWGVDYVSLDAEGHPIRQPYCYRDPRLEGVMEAAFETRSPEEIYGCTGIQFLPFNTLYQCIADRAEGDAVLRAAVHLTMADYFNYRFSGRQVMEISLASTTQMMDVRTGQWARGLMAAFGLDVARWPPVVPSGTRLGPMRSHPEIAVVATCSHDTSSAVAATPAVEPGRGWAYISCGTWSCLGVERPSALVTREAREAAFTNEAGLDGTIRFLKNLTGLWVLQECAREWGGVGWSDLEEEARAAAPVDTTVNLEDGRFLHRNGMEGRLLDCLREQGAPLPRTRGELCRIILESIAESYRRAMGDLERVTGQSIDVIHLFGGGSQNRLLCERTAVRCRKTVVAGPVEATALGNLLIQVRTLGCLPPGVTVRDVSARSSFLHAYEPDALRARTRWEQTARGEGLARTLPDAS